MIVNLTPHAICLNDGRIFPPSGAVARVTKDFVPGRTIDGISTWREVIVGMENVPNANDGNTYIVSGMVLEALRGFEGDCYTNIVAPSTGHPSTVRNAAGHIVSVAGFVGRI